MKKFLSVLGALSLTATSSAMVIACGTNKTEENPPKPDEGSKGYEINQELINLATQRAQSLVIGDQFNLNQKAVYNTINSDQTKYLELFNEDSTKGLNLANSSIGVPGGIFNEFIPEDFDLKDLLGGLDLSSLPAGLIENILKGKGVEQITNIFITIAPILRDLGLIFEMAFSAIQGIEISGPISTVISTAIDFITNNLSSETVQPILSALATGTDLTRFSELSVNQVFPGFILGIVEGIKYGLDPTYEGLNLAEDLANGPTTTLDIRNAAKYLYENINNGNINNFSLYYNPGKVIESFLTSLTILNTILSIYRTPEISFSDESVDYSLNIFSETENNNTYVAKQGNILLKDLTIKTATGTEPRNLNGLNYGELIANIQYYLGNGQYALQKLFYVLLFNGTKATALYDFLMNIVDQIQSGVGLLKDFLVDVLIEPLVNNQKLKLGELPTRMSFLWGIVRGQLEKAIPALVGKTESFLVSIDDFFGKQAFNTLYSGELRDFLLVVKDVIGEETYNNALSGIKSFIGNEPLNFETLLTKINLEKIIFLIQGKLDHNKNIPGYDFSYYTDKSIQELVIELGNTFSISMNASSEELQYHSLDFKLLEVMANELLFGNEQTDSLLLQIKNLIASSNVDGDLEASPITMKNILELLGYIPEEGLNVKVKTNSFLGHLFAFLAPGILSKKEETGEFETVSTLDFNDIHNHLGWLFEGISKIIPNLIQTDDITNFVSDIFMANKKVFKPVVEEGLSEVPYESLTWFKNKKDLKSYTFNLFFNPNEISFADGSKLSGNVSVYTFTVSRETPTDQFVFTNVNKLIIK